MKKYRLIKTYLNSPSLGAEVEEQFFSKCNLEHENFSEFWEEVVEKEYEILSLCSSDGNISDRYKDGKVMWTTDDSPKFYDIENILNKGEHTIHSVKRLSDNEIFTVGDKVFSDFTNDGLQYIHSFSLRDSNSIVKLLKEDCKDFVGFRNLRFLEKANVLFTTEDGVDICEGDKFYWFSMKNVDLYGINLENNAKKGTTQVESKHFLKFSTKEAAERYILENKPCLSLKDVFRIYPEFKKREPTDKRTAHANQLIKIVKSKL